MTDSPEQIAARAIALSSSANPDTLAALAVAALRDHGLLRDEPEPVERRTDWHTGLPEYRPTEGSD